jgi:hypothetical protein
MKAVRQDVPVSVLEAGVKVGLGTYLMDRIRATINPYRPKTSAKIRMRIIPTNSLGCCAVPRTPASPTIPIAKPAARPDKPTLRPAPRWRKLLQHKQHQHFRVQ